ncbi:hypothetical protein EON77_10045 [bacterium]|nr:MAG: hypothetical protein EON77_10045 [bacterium]
MRALRAVVLPALLALVAAGCSAGDEVAMMGDHPAAIGAAEADPALVRDKSGVPPQTAPEGTGRGGAASESNGLATARLATR